MSLIFPMFLHKDFKQLENALIWYAKMIYIYISYTIYPQYVTRNRYQTILINYVGEHHAGGFKQMDIEKVKCHLDMYKYTTLSTFSIYLQLIYILPILLVFQWFYIFNVNSMHLSTLLQGFMACVCAMWVYVINETQTNIKYLFLSSTIKRMRKY